MKRKKEMRNMGLAMLGVPGMAPAALKRGTLCRGLNKPKFQAPFGTLVVKN